MQELDAPHQPQSSSSACSALHGVTQRAVIGSTWSKIVDAWGQANKSSLNP